MRLDGWQTLGDPAPQNLKEVKRLVALAVRPLWTAVPRPKVELTGQAVPTGQWCEPLQAMLMPALADGTRLGLRLTDFTLIRVLPTGQVAAVFPLRGVTGEDVHQWILGRVRQDGLIAPAVGGDEPAHADMPRGQIFELPDPEALAELSRWFSNAHHVIDDVRRSHDRADPVTVRLQKLDIVTRIFLDADRPVEQRRALLVGMSPGDAQLEMPYFFVQPMPRPTNAELPRLAGGGEWKDNGGLAAVLPALQIIRAGSGPAQARRLSEFLLAAISSGYRLLGGLHVRP